VSDPYLHIKCVGARVETRGRPACSLGHQIRRPESDTPDGVFAGWTWDGHTLRIRNDRYGFYPLYYFAAPEEICVSPSIVTLLKQGAPTDLDEPALSVLLRLGCFIGEDTPFRHIRGLPPAAHFEWRPGALRVSGEPAIGKPSGLSRDAALDGFIVLVRQAVARRLPSTGAFAMPLSGGKDSRHILLNLCAAGYRPEICVTVKHYPPRPNEDAEIAAEITARLGLPHVILDPLARRVEAEREKNLTIGLCSYEHAQFLPMAHYLTGRFHTAYDGLGGDTLTASPLLTDLRFRLYDAGCLAELGSSLFINSEKILSRILTAQAYRRFHRDLALEHLTAALAQHVNAPCPVDSFRFWNMSRRSLTLPPYRLFAGIPEVFAPYLDHDVYDLLASLPSTMLLDHAFHAAAIRRAFPAYRDIRFENHQAPLVRDLRHSRRFSLDLLRFTLSHGSSSLVRQSRMLPWWVRCGLSRDPHPRLVIYLLQLEQLVRGCPPPRDR
jgi:hypothetical protein